MHGAVKFIGALIVILGSKWHERSEFHLEPKKVEIHGPNRPSAEKNPAWKNNAQGS